MNRSKLGLIGLCIAVMSVMAFVTSLAHAAEWLILNLRGEVKTGAELNAPIVGTSEPAKDGTLLTHLVGLSLGILCTGLTLNFTQLEAFGEIDAGGAVFTGCTVQEEPKGTQLANCTVSNPGGTVGTVATNSFKGKLQTNGETLIESHTTVVEAGKKVGVFAELRFEGTECPLKALGTTPIKGVFWIKDCEGKVETHLVKHLIVESKAKFTKDKKGELTIGTLWLGTNNEEHLKTSVDGSALVFLSGFHESMAWGATLP